VADFQELLIDAPPLPIPKHHQFRKSWRWPHAVESFFALRIEDKYSLHVCCGQSEVGDIRIDLDPTSKRTQEGDMRSIPFPNNTFDVVFGDWPWKMNYYQRFRPFYEMIRVCKVGGAIIINATWISHSEVAVLKETFVRCDFPFGQASVILVYEKTSDARDGPYDHCVSMQTSNKRK